MSPTDISLVVLRFLMKKRLDVTLLSPTGSGTESRNMYYYRRLPKFEYLAPKSIGEVSALLRQHRGEARILAGGTIVLHRMKERIGVRPYVIGIKGVPDLDTIAVEDTGALRLGSLAGLQEIADAAEVRKNFPLLSTVCGLLGTPQIRNMGTIGGNVACRFATAETVPALIALAAKANVVTEAGGKLILVEELYKKLRDGDLITEIRVEALPAHTYAGYKKFAVRDRFDYATVSAAVRMTLDGLTCREIRIGLGGVTLQTMRARAAENAMKGEKLTDGLIKKVAGIAADDATVHPDMMFSRDYKKKVLRVMVERAIQEAGGETPQ